jgi:hypothetical protein
VVPLQKRTVTVSEPAQVPLALLTVQQAQSAQRVDTNAQIALFLNQSIDASQLEMKVFETAFDKTWRNQDAQGTEFFNAKGLQLVDVQGDQKITKALKGTSIYPNYSARMGAFFELYLESVDFLPNLRSTGQYWQKSALSWTIFVHLVTH